LAWVHYSEPKSTLRTIKLERLQVKMCVTFIYHLSRLFKGLPQGIVRQLTPQHRAQDHASFVVYGQRGLSRSHLANWIFVVIIILVFVPATRRPDNPSIIRSSTPTCTRFPQQNCLSTILFKETSYNAKSGLMGSAEKTASGAPGSTK
jgi:hypothetical protein